MTSTEEECRKFMTSISTLSEKNALASEQLISLLQQKNAKLKEKVTILNAKNDEKDRQLEKLGKELEERRKEEVVDPAGSSLEVAKLNQQLTHSRQLQHQLAMEKGEKEKLVILLEEQLKTKSNLLDKFEDELSTAKLTILNNEAILKDNNRHLTERGEQVRLLSLEVEQLKVQCTDLKMMYDASVQAAQTEHQNSMASLKAEKEMSEQKLATQEHTLAKVTMTLDEIRKLLNTSEHNASVDPADPTLVSNQPGAEQIHQPIHPGQQQLKQDTGSAQQYQTVYMQLENVADGSNSNPQQDGYHVFDIIPGSVIPIYNKHEDLIKIPHSIPSTSSTPLLVQHGSEPHSVLPTNILKRTSADMEHSSDDDDVGSSSEDDDHNSDHNVNATKPRRYTDEELVGMRIADGRRCLLCPPEKQWKEHSSIKRHIMEVHKMKLKCYYCGKQYVRLDKLRAHEKQEHGATHIIPKPGRPKRNKTNG